MVHGRPVPFGTRGTRPYGYIAALGGVSVVKPMRLLVPICCLVVMLLSACAGAPRPRSVPVPAPVPAADSSPAPPRDALLDYLSERELMVPVEGVRVSQVPNTFTEKRGDRAHNANDIMAKRGTPVLSADDGHIIRLANNSLGGITIYATDPHEKLVYYYAHLDRYESGLKAGEKLHKGDVIGYVGSTGNASPQAPHLHFQVARMTDISRHWEGVPIDARSYFVLDGERR